MRKVWGIAAAFSIAAFATINAEAQVQRLSGSVVSEHALSANSKAQLAKLREGLAVSDTELQTLDKNAFSGDYITVTLAGKDHTYKKQSQDTAPDGAVVWSGMRLTRRVP